MTDQANRETRADPSPVWRVLIPFDIRECLSPKEAAAAAGRNKRTLHLWCAEHGIGRRIRGQWMVSKVALQMLLEGDDDALVAYRHGCRGKEEPVARYYRRLGLEDLLDLPEFHV